MKLSTEEKVGAGLVVLLVLYIVARSGRAQESERREAPVLTLDEVPAQRTSADTQDVRAALYNEWTAIMGENPTDKTIAMLMAHSALETGNWKSMWNWNLGNITTRSGRFFRIPAPGQEKYKYRPHDSLEAGAREFILYLQRAQPDAFALLDAERADQYAAALKAGAYYEAPEAEYAAALRKLYVKYFRATE